MKISFKLIKHGTRFANVNNWIAIAAGNMVGKTSQNILMHQDLFCNYLDSE